MAVRLFALLLLALQSPKCLVGRHSSTLCTTISKSPCSPYYREPAKSPGPLPVHLIKPLARSFAQDRCALPLCHGRVFCVPCALKPGVRLCTCSSPSSC